MSAEQTSTGEVQIDVALVRRLLAAQFPQWADLPIRPAVPQGWDNRTFHLGADLSVRLPSASGYIQQVEKEHRWLPTLARHLPLAIPVPLAQGVPGEGYPFPWSIYRWIDGQTASVERIADLAQFATDLAHFLVALQEIDAAGGPPPGPHNFYRGAPLDIYDAETRQALVALDGLIDTDTARAVWETALQTTWQRAPVWFQGDVAVGNLLVKNGRLHAVIDFGTSGVGDPACDTVIAWTFLSGASREAFYAALPLDRDTWARGRGWALWKALITMAPHISTSPLEAEKVRYVIDEVLADHRCFEH
jgi:aminoglycoside phosphotransferase (APT) family kinase protein